MNEVLSGTRVFGDFQPDRYAQLMPFIKNAASFGESVIVTQRTYPNLDDLVGFVAISGRPGKEVYIKLSETTGAQSPADMCNQIIYTCADSGYKYFAVVSSDLADFIPQTFPLMLERLENDQTLASVGVAIQGVHNFALLDEVETEGMDAVTVDNYATIFHNNAFAIHRMYPEVGKNVLSFEDRLFPRITDQGTLGSVEIDGQTIPIGGNEEIALALQLLKQDKPLDTLLLTGLASIIRDPDRELSSIEAKILRRPKVAEAYQKHYGLENSQVTDYLYQHYHVAFV